MCFFRRWRNDGKVVNCQRFMDAENTGDGEYESGKKYPELMHSNIVTSKSLLIRDGSSLAKTDLDDIAGTSSNDKTIVIEPFLETCYHLVIFSRAVNGLAQ